jgi:hypothetical protein
MEFKNTIKLNKNKRQAYMGVIRNEEFQQWNLKESYDLSVSEFIQVYSDDISIVKEINNTYDVTVNNGMLVSTVSSSNSKEEFPFIITNKMAENIILETMLEVKSFNKMIDVKNKKISSNSSKVMTLSSLERIIHNIFNEVSFEEAITLAPKLKNYVENVISINNSLKMSNVEELKNLKKRSIINSTFSWYIILSYFIEENREKNIEKINIPQLNKNVVKGSWTGNFFDKDNPMWKEIFASKRMFYPSKENLATAYSLWLLKNKS